MEFINYGMSPEEMKIMELQKKYPTFDFVIKKDGGEMTQKVLDEHGNIVKRKIKFDGKLAQQMKATVFKVSKTYDNVPYYYGNPSQFGLMDAFRGMKIPLPISERFAQWIEKMSKYRLMKPLTSMYFKYIAKKLNEEHKAERSDIERDIAQILDTVPKENNIMKLDDKSPYRWLSSAIYQSELKPDSVINVFDMDTEEYRTVNANLLYAHMNGIKPGAVVDGVEYKAEEPYYPWVRESEPFKEHLDANRQG